MSTIPSKGGPLVVVVGSCMIDFVSYSTHCPKQGETVCAKKFVTNFGGKGANQCVAAARLGASSALIARLGDDVWGTRYLENLAREHINTEYVKKMANSESGIAQITVTEAGSSQIVIIPGANEQMTESDVEEAKEIIMPAPVVVLQLETSQDVAIKTMQLARGKVILNAAPALTEYDPRLMKMPAIFCVNETEASTFSGLPVETVEDAAMAARKLMSLGCISVIITLGEKGCLYTDREGEIQHFAAPEVECVDSTGAGDAFIGALAYMLAIGKSMKVSIEVAIKVSADSVTKPGTQKSFPDNRILQKLKVI